MILLSDKIDFKTKTVKRGRQERTPDCTTRANSPRRCYADNYLHTQHWSTQLHERETVRWTATLSPLDNHLDQKWRCKI